MSSHAELIQDVLSETPLIDGHNDLPYALRTTADSSVEGLEAETAAAERVQTALL